MYFQLFWNFFKLGSFTIGGGMAMIPLIKDIVVEKEKWLTGDEMIDCLAISQGLPGVIAVNVATYIGYRLKGIKGAMVATLGVVMPSFFIIIALIKFLSELGDNVYIDGAIRAIKSAAAGLILVAAYGIGKSTLKSVSKVLIAFTSFALVGFASINGLWAIVAGIIIGIGTSYYEKWRDR